MEAEAAGPSWSAENQSDDQACLPSDTEVAEPARRLVAGLLGRVQLQETVVPDVCSWRRFLEELEGLLVRQHDERTALKRALDDSARAIDLLNEELRLSREQLAKDHGELRAANSMLAATLESTADGILVVNATGQITSLNRRFADLWRIPEEILASRDDNAALAFVLGQLRDPGAFIAKVEALYQTPTLPVRTYWNSSTVVSSNGSRYPSDLTA